MRASPKISKNNNTIGQAWPQQTILPTTTNHNGYHRMPTTYKESEKAFSLSLNSTTHRAASERRTTISDKLTTAAMISQTSETRSELRREYQRSQTPENSADKPAKSYASQGTGNLVSEQLITYQNIYTEMSNSLNHYCSERRTEADRTPITSQLGLHRSNFANMKKTASNTANLNSLLKYKYMYAYNNYYNTFNIKEKHKYDDKEHKDMAQNEVRYKQNTPPQSPQITKQTDQTKEMYKNNTSLDTTGNTEYKNDDLRQINKPQLKKQHIRYTVSYHNSDFGGQVNTQGVLSAATKTAQKQTPPLSSPSPLSLYCRRSSTISSSSFFFVFSSVCALSVLCCEAPSVWWVA